MATRLMAAAGAAPGPALGARLRALRQAAGLTLDALAEAASLDKGYLSRVERGLKAPSIATLLRLSEALAVPVGELFGESVAEHAVRVTRRADRVAGPGGDPDTARFETFSRAGGALEAFVIYPAPSFAAPAAASEHSGEELLLVLSGTIEMRFADRGFVLETGDCAQFPGHLAHRLRRVGDEHASALVAVARPPRR
ncbi:helix-turn-helix domain-containing protein [Roseomonas sp. KE0001]|uniref:helix-turn-helix domain-containing protein n=1 Tax=Roseomonas sp. KE0001 TaxID=2479201 RepID=UPI0018DF70F4|nr:XRE family transcriptional regulator [Roseomonas sp. KE0001]